MSQNQSEIIENLPVFFEQSKVVTLEDPNALNFHELVTKNIINPLLKSVLKDKRFGPKLRELGYSKPEDFNIQNLLSYGEGDNAFTIPIDNPAYIVIHKDLIYSVIGSKKPITDQIVYIYGHELAHQIIRLVFGEGKNSKGEEGDCDILSLEWGLEAGFNSAQGAEDIILRIYKGINILKKEDPKSPTEGLEDEISIISDIHINLPNRLETVRKYKASQRRLVTGELESSSDEIGLSLQAAADKVKHVSYSDKFIAKVNWNSLSIDEKVDVLVEEIDSFDKHNLDYKLWSVARLARPYPENILLQKSYSSRFKSGIATVTDDPDFTGIHSEKLATALIKKASLNAGVRTSALFSYLFMGLTSKFPIKEFDNLKKLTKKFINAQNEADIITAGAKFLEAMQSFNSEESTFPLHIATDYRPEGFKVTKVGTPPWELHFKVAKKLADKGDYSLVKALWQAGVHDPRMFDICDQATLEEIVKLTHLAMTKDNNFSLSASGDIYTEDNEEFENREADDLPIDVQNYFKAKYLFEKYTEALAKVKSSGKISSAATKYASVGLVSITQVAPEALFEHWEYLFDTFESHELRHPLRSVKHVLLEETETVNTQNITILDDHIKAAKHVVKKLEWLLDSDQNPDYLKDPKKYRDFVRGLYLGRDDKRDLITALGLGSIGKKGDFTRGNHPYLKFFATSDDLFTFEERYKVLEPILYNVDSAIIKKALLGDKYNLSEKLEELNQYNLNSPKLRQIGADLILQYLREKPEADITELLGHYRQFFIGFKDVKERDNNYVRHRISQTSFPASLEEKIVMFRTLERGRLFPDDQYRANLSKEIQDTIKTLNDADKVKYAELLICSLDTSKTSLHEISDKYSDSDVAVYDEHSKAISKRKTQTSEHVQNTDEAQLLKDYQLRKFALDTWVESQAQLLGTDDASKAYEIAALAAVTNISERITPVTSLGVRLKLFSGLAKRITAQKAVAFSLRDNVGGLTKDSLREIGEYLNVGELSLSRMSRNPAARIALIEFLTSPLSDESLYKFYNQADPRGSRTLLKAMEAEAKYLGHYNSLRRKLEDISGGAIRANETRDDDIRELDDLIADIDYPIIEGFGSDIMLKEAINPDAWRIGFSIFDYSVEETESESVLDTLPAALKKLLVDKIDELHTADAGYEAIYARLKENIHECIKKLPSAEFKTTEQGPIIVALLEEYSSKFAKASNAEYDQLRDELVTKLKEEYGQNAQVQKFYKGLDAKKTQRGGMGFIAANKDKLLSVRSEVDVDAYIKRLHAADSMLDEILKQLRFRSLDKVIAEAKKADLELVPYLQTKLDRLIAERDAYEKADYDVEQEWQNMLDSVDRKITNIESFYAELLKQLDARGEGYSLEVRIKQAADTVYEDMELTENIQLIAALEEFEKVVEKATVEIVGRDFEEYQSIAASYIKAAEVDNDVTEPERIDAVTLHENFRYASLTEKAFVLDQLLITPEQKAEDAVGLDEKNFAEALDYVLEKFMPEQDEESLRLKHSFRCYVKVVPVDEKPIILSVIATVMQKAEDQGQNLSLGEKLAMLAELMGPFEVKLGQAGSYDERVKPEMREGLGKKLKNKAAESLWWDLVERYEQTPAEVRANIKRITGVAGEASIQQSIFVEEHNGEEGVMNLQRENVQARGEYGARIASAYVTELMNSGEYTDTASIFIDLIDHGNANLALESSHIHGLRQVEIATEQAEKTTVTFNGYTGNIHAAAWKACGPTFRYQKGMKGIFFSNIPSSIAEKQQLLVSDDVSSREKLYIAQLPDNDQELADIKKAVSVIYISFMATNILTGEEIDYDRHDKQTLFLIDPKKRTIDCNQFDHGCLALKKPSTFEKQQLGRAVVNIALSASTGQSVNDAVLANVNKAKAELVELAAAAVAGGKAPISIRPDYLIRVEKALNTLKGDFAGTLTKPQKYFSQLEATSLLSAIFRAGLCDKEIYETVRGELYQKVDTTPSLEALKSFKFMLRMIPQSAIAGIIESKLQTAGEIKISRSRQTGKPEQTCKVFDEENSPTENMTETSTVIKRGVSNISKKPPYNKQDLVAASADVAWR